MERISKYATKSDFREIIGNYKYAELRITLETNTTFYVICPYDLKNPFKKKFNAKWNAEKKQWEVSKLDFERADLEDYFYPKNKKFYDLKIGKTVKTTTVKATKKTVNKEVFEDFCEDVGAYTTEAKKEVMKKYF